MRSAITVILRGTSLLLMAAACPAPAQSLSPQEVFRRGAPSVVVIEVYEDPENGPSRLIASGSGVVVQNHTEDKSSVLVATNCHVVDKAPEGVVTITQEKSYGIGFVQGRDAKHDLCLVHASIIGDSDSSGDIALYTDDKGNFSPKRIPAAQVGSSQNLEVGDAVYAIGAPQGLELSLSGGLVSGFREHKGSGYIQTTAPISKGSSGGGLFDAQGRLVGITTMYVKDGQALNFAVPADLIASIPEYKSDKIRTAPKNPTSESGIAKNQGRWHVISYDEPSNSTHYIDTKSLIASGNSITAWIKNTSGLGAAWIIDGKSIPYYEEFERINFSCDTWEIFVSESYITKHNGSQIASRGKLGPFTVSPTSDYDPVISAVCLP